VCREIIARVIINMPSPHHRSADSNPSAASTFPDFFTVNTNTILFCKRGITSIATLNLVRQGRSGYSRLAEQNVFVFTVKDSPGNVLAADGVPNQRTVVRRRQC